jgi:hypothetical protein
LSLLLKGKLTERSNRYLHIRRLQAFFRVDKQALKLENKLRILTELSSIWYWKRFISYESFNPQLILNCQPRKVFLHFISFRRTVNFLNAHGLYSSFYSVHINSENNWASSPTQYFFFIYFIMFYIAYPNIYNTTKKGAILQENNGTQFCHVWYIRARKCMKDDRIFYRWFCNLCCDFKQRRHTWMNTVLKEEHCSSMRVLAQSSTIQWHHNMQACI